MTSCGRLPRADASGHDASLGLVRVRRGVWAPEARWRGLKPWERCQQEHRALDMAARNPLIFCRESSVLMRGWPILHVPQQAHVVLGVHGTGSRRTDREITGHSWPVTADEVEDSGDVFTTTAARTVADCARELPLRDAVVIADYYLHEGGEAEAVERYLHGGGLRRGIRRAAVVLRRADGRSDSVGETLTRLILEDAGLGGFVPQCRVDTEWGTYFADFAWPECAVIVEFDGDIKYSGRFGAGQEVIRAEREREKALTNAGWRVLRVNWAMITGTPQRVVEMVRAELARGVR